MLISNLWLRPTWVPILILSLKTYETLTWFLNILNWLKFFKFTIAHLKVSRSREVPRHSVLGLQLYFFLMLLACPTLQSSWTGKSMCAGVLCIILKEDIKKQTKKGTAFFMCLPRSYSKNMSKDFPCCHVSDWGHMVILKPIMVRKEIATHI